MNTTKRKKKSKISINIHSSARNSQHFYYIWNYIAEGFIGLDESKKAGEEENFMVLGAAVEFE
jgi:hypothetical protein